MVKNPPANAGDAEMQFPFLGWEDPPEKEMVTHSSISCLENSVNRGACWATVPGVAKSQTCTVLLYLTQHAIFEIHLCCVSVLNHV